MTFLIARQFCILITVVMDNCAPLNFFGLPMVRIFRKPYAPNLPHLSPEDKEITGYYCYYCYFSLLVLRLYSSAVLGTTGGVGMSVFHFVFISRIFTYLTHRFLAKNLTDFVHININSCCCIGIF